MKPASKRDRECEAAWTVAALLHGSPIRRDKEGASDGTHDFDVHRDDGRIIALEVTSSTVREIAEMWDAIHRLDWHFHELSQSWSVSLSAAQPGSPGALVGRFRQRAPRWLAVLDRERPPLSGDVIGSPHDEHLSDVAREAISELRHLGARHASPIGTMTDTPYVISVGMSGPLGPTDGSSIIADVERAVTENLAKLRRADADERHLFVWVDMSDPASEVAMGTFSVPDRSPSLVKDVDSVWVGWWMSNVTPESHIYVLWRWNAEDGWRVEQVPKTRSYAKERTT